MNPSAPVPSSAIGIERLSSPLIPTEELITEVFASAEPDLRRSMLSQLLGKVYQAAPAPQRWRLVRQLMQPLGILSLLAVANGVFATLRLQGGLSHLQDRWDDVPGVQVEDVIDLANFAQQVSAQAFDGLAQWLSASPALAGSAAALVLTKILLEQAKHRREGDR